MRLLKFNDEKIDIDEKTAIGIDFQSYDIKEPGKRRVNVTNTFTIPKTSNNMKLLGHAGNPEWIGDEISSVQIGCEIYNEIVCDYWVDNEQLLTSAKIRIDNIAERISIFVFEKKTVWDELKNLLWSDFQIDYLAYANVPKSGSTVDVPWSDFLDTYCLGSDSEIFLPLFFGHLYGLHETDTNIYTQYYDATELKNYYGGHFCIFIEKIFEFIETTYGVNFLTPKNQIATGLNVTANIFDDVEAKKIHVPARNIGILTVPSQTVLGFNVNNGIDFAPLNSPKDKADKTVYDLVDGFFKMFNIVIDEIEIDGVDVILLRRFDALEDYAQVKNWSNRIDKQIPEFSPLSQNYGQNSLIKFSSVYEGGDTLINSRTLTSKNLNSDIRKNLFSIDGFIPNFIEAVTTDLVANLTQAESFKTFQFFTWDDSDKYTITVAHDTSIYTGSASKELFLSRLYSLNSEYTLLDNAITYPKFYTIQKWLTLSDVVNLEYFKLYYIRQLNGSFFLNKISGFNPQFSKQATTLELMRVSDRVPITPPEAEDYYCDGIYDPFTDGTGDYFY